MSITKENITQTSALASIRLSQQQAESFRDQLDQDIDSIDQINTIDTDGVEPTTQICDMANVWRSDDIQLQEADRESLLALAKDIEDNQIKVPKVL